MPPLIAAIVAIGAAIAALNVTSIVVTALVGGLISTGLGLAASAIFGGSKTPKTPALTIGNRASKIIDNVTGTVEYIPVAYGRTKIGGIKIYCQTGSSSSNNNLFSVIAFCEGEIEEIEEVYIDDTISTDDKFDGKFEIWKRTGTDTQLYIKEFSDAGAPDWGESHRGLGIAYLAAKFEKDTELFPRIPIITAVVKGRKVYDPRTATTAWSDNPVLCILDYLTNTRFGKGLSLTNDIDVDSFIEGANYCDVLVGGVKRYTLNGFLDTGRTILENLDEMMTSCNGTLCFTGGKHRFIIMKPESSTFSFTRDLIVGGIEIQRKGKKGKYNKIEAAFINPSTNWQGDLAIVENESYLASDNNTPLVFKLDLPYTISFSASTLLAQIALKQSRLDTTVSFKSTLAALACEVGDVVSFTHPNYGWVSKLFRVSSMTLEADCTVGLQLEEYDADVYTADAVPTELLGGSSNLQNPFTVSAPGVPVVTQEYDRTTAGDVKNKVILTWSTPISGFVYSYEPEYKLTTDTNYTKLAPVKGLTANIYDIPAGLYNFRVRAINTLGTASDYATIAREVFNETTTPADVTNFREVTSDRSLVFYWDEEPQALAGGKYRIKYNSATTGVTWNNLDNFTVDITGRERSITLALLQGTYLIKAVNLAGIESANASTVTIVLPDEAQLATVLTVTEDPTFSGTKTNMAVVDGTTLQLDGQTAWDDIAGDWDDIEYNFDAAGNLNLTGSYVFGTTVNLGAIYFWQLQKNFQADFVDAVNNWDSKTGNFDDQPGFWDGSGVITGSVQMYYRTTDTDPTGSPVWGDWKPLEVATGRSWGIQFKVEVAVDYNWQNINITQLRPVVKMKARNVASSLTTTAGSNVVTFSKAFYSAPTVVANIVNPTTGDYFTISAVTKSDFTITCYNASNVAVIRNVTYNAYGVGEAI